MTEQKWLDEENLFVLLDATPIRQAERKIRLFGCACCELVDRWLIHPRARKALDRAYQYADGLLSDTSLSRWASEIWEVCTSNSLKGSNKANQQALQMIAHVCGSRNHADYRFVGHLLFVHEVFDSFDETFVPTTRPLALALFRDIFGNPFRRTHFDPSWGTSNVLDIARTIYEEKTFDHMPILADALVDAGCNNEDILNHCHGSTPHVRGCWVVDWILGKE
jgi:hypothetical protein